MIIDNFAGKKRGIKIAKDKKKGESCKIVTKTDLDGYVDITYSELDSKLNYMEPIYCFCNYISFGNMIKCDNEKVSAYIKLCSVSKNGFISSV